MALYSSLIYTFRHFRKKLKMDAERDLKKLSLCSKIDTRALPGRLILRFGSFLGASKNRRFFDAAPARPKSSKKRPPSQEPDHENNAFATVLFTCGNNDFN